MLIIKTWIQMLTFVILIQICKAKEIMGSFLVMIEDIPTIKTLLNFRLGLLQV